MEVNLLNCFVKYFFSLIYGLFLFKTKTYYEDIYSTVKDLLVLLQLKLFNLHNKYTLLMITLIIIYQTFPLRPFYPWHPLSQQPYDLVILIPILQMRN